MGGRGHRSSGLELWHPALSHCEALAPLCLVTLEGRHMSRPCDRWSPAPAAPKLAIQPHGFIACWPLQSPFPPLIVWPVPSECPLPSSTPGNQLLGTKAKEQMSAREQVPVTPQACSSPTQPLSSLKPVLTPAPCSQPGRRSPEPHISGAPGLSVSWA